jgi:hypothetical protein
MSIEPFLIERVETSERFCDRRVDVGDGGLHALAEIARLVAVAQLYRLARTGRGAAGYGRATDRTVGKRHFSFERGVAARVEDFAGENLADLHHLLSLDVGSEGSTSAGRSTRV